MLPRQPLSFDSLGAIPTPMHREMGASFVIATPDMAEVLKRDRPQQTALMRVHDIIHTAEASGTSVAKECLNTFLNWEMPECSIQNPSPEVNGLSGLWNYLGWAATSQSSDRMHCLENATNKFTNCLKTPPAKKYVQSYVGVPSGIPHLGQCAGIGYGDIEYDRIIGCDGGITSESRDKDVTKNMSKGIVTSCANLNTPAFCDCPSGASYDMALRKCVCSGMPVYDVSFSLSTGLGQRCCAPIDCNDPSINPLFQENDIFTYKWYNCNSPLPPSDPGRCESKL